MKRRTFIKGSFIPFIRVFSSSALLAPISLLAAWNKEAFRATNMEAANTALGDVAPAEETDRIKIETPEIAENAAVVPVIISSDIENAESIRLYVEKNPSPLIATFQLTKYTDNYVSTRVRMSETSNVIVVVKAGDQLYMTKRKVKVTAGGCGG